MAKSLNYKSWQADRPKVPPKLQELPAERRKGWPLRPCQTASLQQRGLSRLALQILLGMESARQRAALRAHQSRLRAQ